MDYSISKKVVMNLLVRSATSVGANYRATCRTISDEGFIAKLNIEPSLKRHFLLNRRELFSVENQYSASLSINPLRLSAIKRFHFFSFLSLLVEF